MQSLLSHYTVNRIRSRVLESISHFTILFLAAKLAGKFVANAHVMIVFAHKMITIKVID